MLKWTQERSKYTTILFLHYSDSNYCEYLMKTTIKIPGTCTLRKIKDRVSCLAFRFVTYNFFYSPFLYALVQRNSCVYAYVPMTKTTCIHVRAQKKLMVSSLLWSSLFTRRRRLRLISSPLKYQVLLFLNRNVCKNTVDSFRIMCTFN